jgi:hypothetical protein
MLKELPQKGLVLLTYIYNAIHRIGDWPKPLRTANIIGKVKLSLYRPWRPLGLQEVEALTFSDIRLIDGGKVVSPTMIGKPGKGLTDVKNYRPISLLPIMTKLLEKLILRRLNKDLISRMDSG